MRKGKESTDRRSQSQNTSRTMDRPATDCRKTYAITPRLMCDIIAIAFQTNKTASRR